MRERDSDQVSGVVREPFTADGLQRWVGFLSAKHGLSAPAKSDGELMNIIYPDLQKVLDDAAREELAGRISDLLEIDLERDLPEALRVLTAQLDLPMIPETIDEFLKMCSLSFLQKRS